MGYRSDVHIGVAFDDAEVLCEVMSIYPMDPNVRKHDTVSKWELMHGNVLYYCAEYVKWYEGYDEVKAVEHLLDVIKLFADERNISVAWYFIRLGENEDDLETGEYQNGTEGDGLMSYLLDAMRVYRSVGISFLEPIRGQELS